MAFTRKDLGSGQVASASTETSIYQPATDSITGVIGSLTFYNAHATDQITVTVYGPHSGAATSSDIIDKAVINPGKSYICRVAVNKVVQGQQLISVECDTASALNYSIAGGEE